MGKRHFFKTCFSPGTRPLECSLYLKLFEKMQAILLQFCTHFLRSRKLVHLNGKNLSCFTWNLVQNLMSLTLISKSNRKWSKLVKTKIVRKNNLLEIIWDNVWSLYFLKSFPQRKHVSKIITQNYLILIEPRFNLISKQDQVISWLNCLCV